jgi:hypothetical protein
MPKSTTVLSAALVLWATAAVAADDRLPNIDLQKRCAARTQALGDNSGDKSITAKTFDSCMKSEQEARAALQAAWKDIPARYKASCIQPNVYSPSYMEWISCLELQIDIKNLRAKN